jgi:asparagine synthetase B (glutamine-hydrolysing)
MIITLAHFQQIVIRVQNIIAQGSPDLKAAKEVANYLGTVHHEFHFTVQVATCFIS